VIDELIPISVPPETHPSLRRGHLMLLLQQVDGPMTIDRIGYVEFFAANPFLVWRHACKERTRLLLAGLSPKALSYQATTERYANRRTRLRSDLAALAAWGYIVPAVVDKRLACELTPAGRGAAEGLGTLYADAYRLSVSLVLPKLRRVTNVELNRLARDWLRVDDLKIDLLDTDFRFDADLQGEIF
jgi:hypothetical protein